jgi:hypothetical protein
MAGGGSSPKGVVSGGGGFTSGSVGVSSAAGHGQEAREVKWCSWHAWKGEGGQGGGGSDGRCPFKLVRLRWGSGGEDWQRGGRQERGGWWVV